MKIIHDNKPFEGSATNTQANLADGISRAVGEARAALGKAPNGRFEATEIAGHPDVTVTIQFGKLEEPKKQKDLKEPKGSKEPKEQEPPKE